MIQPLVRRWRISPWALLWLTLVWVLLWGHLTMMSVISGLVVGFLVLALFPLPHIRLRLRARPIGLVVLTARFLHDLVRASIEVTWLAIRPGPVTRGVVMDMELVGDEPLLQTLTAEMVALVPGSVVIDLDSRSRILTIHALDVSTRTEAEKVRHRVRAQEARVLRALHPDAEELLHPRRRREAQRRAAERGPVQDVAGEDIEELGADEAPQDDEARADLPEPGERDGRAGADDPEQQEEDR